MKPRHLALILLIDVIWAFNLVAVKEAVEAARPITAVALPLYHCSGATLPWLRWLPGRMPVVLVTGLVAGALFMGLGGLSFALADNVSALAIAGQLGVPFRCCWRCSSTRNISAGRASPPWCCVSWALR